MSFLNRHMNIHTCIYRFLTLLKNSVSPLYSARKSGAETINARMHEWFGITCRHCAAGKQQVGSTVLQDSCVPATMLFGQSSNKYTEPSHTLPSTNAAQWQKEKLSEHEQSCLTLHYQGPMINPYTHTDWLSSLPGLCWVEGSLGF